MFNMLLNLSIVFLILMTIFSTARSYIWFLFKPSRHFYSLSSLVTLQNYFFFQYFKYSLFFIWSCQYLHCAWFWVCHFFSADVTHAILFPHVFCEFFWCIFEFVLLEILSWGIFWASFELYSSREYLCLLLLSSWVDNQLKSTLDIWLWSFVCSWMYEFWSLDCMRISFWVIFLSKDISYSSHSYIGNNILVIHLLFFIGCFFFFLSDSQGRLSSSSALKNISFSTLPPPITGSSHISLLCVGYKIQTLQQPWTIFPILPQGSLWAHTCFSGFCFFFLPGIYAFSF